VFEQPDGTIYHGYYQSYRYLEECRPSLLRWFRFRLEYRARSEAMLFAYRRRYRRPIVSIHVRRGDYVSTGYEDTWGNLASDGYYERAVETIGDDVTYLVFSDDLDWCRRSLNVERALYVDADHCTSLCLLTICDVNVVANSSFSWWGAFLNPNAEVYAPSRWYGPAMGAPNDVQRDIVPPGWRTIPALGDAAVGRG
jgi:Glycosyl transferase family 11